MTTTDAAGKTKTFTTDEVGNLVQVVEPDPAAPATSTYTTSYVYDYANRLISVSMPRGSTTQTRTFTYTGVNLTSVTNPENGTVNSYYNPSDNTLSYKVDAKGQAIVYSYDSYKRVVQISKFPSGYTPGSGVGEDVCQRVNYYYDSNPDTNNYNYTQYLAGRLTSVHYAGSMCQTFNGQTQAATTGNNYIELYGYTQAGQVTRKTLRLQKVVNGPQSPVAVSADLEAVYTYDSEGKILSQSYPLGTTYSYTYDALGRPTKMTDTVANQDLVGSVTYGPAGELLSMSGTSVGETRTYNVNGQLTQISGIGLNVQYNYPAAGANNGQIASQYDVINAETITYTYDSLKRLASATAVQGGTQTWNQNFTYDGFGNLTAKTGSGIAPLATYPVDANTNRLSGISYDNNGNQLYANGSNLAYDVANRMTSSTASSLQGFYEYDPKDQRVYQQRQSWNGSAWATTAMEFYFYGLGGKKVGIYTASVAGSGSGSTLTWSLQTTQVFFRGKLIQRSGSASQEDIRASVGRYFPYGEDRDNTANDTVKFATYIRDSTTLIDYARARYFLPGSGRFVTGDPKPASAAATAPSIWNAYNYANSDPVNNFDPTGMDCASIEPGPRGVDGSVVPCGPADECDPFWQICDPPDRGPGGYSYPTCTIELSTRSIASVPGFQHLVITVTDLFGFTWYIEGERNKAGPGFGYLNSWVSTSAQDPRAVPDVLWTHTSVADCLFVEALKHFASAYQNNTFLYTPWDQNSNSYAYTALVNSGTYWEIPFSVLTILTVGLQWPGWTHYIVGAK